MRANSNDGPSADRGPELMAMIWVLTGTSTITVAMRLVSGGLRASFGWSDFFMVFTLVCFYGWTVCLTVLCLNGGERHARDVIPMGPDVVALVQLLNWTAQVFGILGLAAGKVSVSALLLGILKDSDWSGHKVYLWVACIGLEVAISIPCAVMTLVQCSPPAALWDKRVKGDCIDPDVMASYGTLTGSYNTFVDASLAIIPSTIFFRLQMGLRQKIQLSMVFGFNILTSVCSGVKTSALSQLANRSDFTWATYDIFASNTGEFFLIIFCGTLPTLKPILDTIIRLSPWSKTGCQVRSRSAWSAASGRPLGSLPPRQPDNGGSESDMDRNLVSKGEHGTELSIRTADSGRS